MNFKRQIRGVLAIIVCICMMMGIVSCKKNANETDGLSIVKGDGEISASFFAFDTYMSISVRAGESKGSKSDNGLVSEAQLREVVEEVRRLEMIFSVTDPEAEVYKIDHREADEVGISDEVAELIVFSREIYERSEGALDVTAYPLVKAWGFTTGKYRVPDKSELEELLKTVGMDWVMLRETSDSSMNSVMPDKDISEIGAKGKNISSSCSITLQPGTELDFGAVAKGYLSKVIVGMLEGMGVEHALLDLGGNIVTIGSKPDGSNWKVGIKDPFGNKDMIGYVSVSGQSVITSGGYERYFTGEDGNIYWHIIDPKTGYPARTGIVSATIIGDDPLLCDALSTALFVMGAERARDYYDTYGGFEYVLVMDDGSIITSNGLANSLVIK